MQSDQSFVWPQAKSMKIESGLSEDGKTLYLVLHHDEKIVFDMSIDSATELMSLLYELIKEAKAQQSFLELERSSEN